MMSIGAECLAVESRRILRPGTLAVTNVRLDHMDEMGREKAAIARTLASAVPERADIFIPEEEVDPAFEEAAARTGSKLRAVARGSAGDGPGRRRACRSENSSPIGAWPRPCWSPWGSAAATIERGLAAAAPDPGQPPCLARRVRRPAPSGRLRQPLRRQRAGILGRGASQGQGRPSRSPGGRSSAFSASARTAATGRSNGSGRPATASFREFSSVVLIGPPARAALRKIRRYAGPGGPVFSVAGGRSPEDLMDRAMLSTPGEPVIVGLGNFVGPGDDLVRYWERIGTAHDR